MIYSGNAFWFQRVLRWSERVSSRYESIRIFKQRHVCLKENRYCQLSICSWNLNVLLWHELHFGNIEHDYNFQSRVFLSISLRKCCSRLQTILKSFFNDCLCMVKAEISQVFWKRWGLKYCSYTQYNIWYNTL